MAEGPLEKRPWRPWLALDGDGDAGAVGEGGGGGGEEEPCKEVQEDSPPSSPVSPYLTHGRRSLCEENVQVVSSRGNNGSGGLGPLGLRLVPLKRIVLKSPMGSDGDTGTVGESGGGGGREEPCMETEDASLSSPGSDGSGGLGPLGLRLVPPKRIMLKSPLGSEPMVYNWPLKKGRGRMGKAEDTQDEAIEIVETIQFVCADNPNIEKAMQGSHYLMTYDMGIPFEDYYYNLMAISERYNNAVDELVESGKATISRVTPTHLKHILNQCYNKSVKDPNELNNYEAFTPEVYGEISFELMWQILDQISPIKREDKFVDLGSGVGQVVLQVAALTDCSFSLGIEKVTTRASYAKDMEKWFRFWMAFYGKSFKPFKLIAGDFFDPNHQQAIVDSTIVFVNNFAFGPEVDHSLKDIFANMRDATKIISCWSFCPLNFRITARNFGTDIGAIMHVSKMGPLKGSVSWTGKPVSYFIHVIDRTKLERYFRRKRKDPRIKQKDSTGVRKSLRIEDVAKKQGKEREF